MLYLTKERNVKQRLLCLLVHICAILDALIYICSLSVFSAELAVEARFYKLLQSIQDFPDEEYPEIHE